MSLATGLLGDTYARTLPELCVPWSAARPSDPRVVVANEALGLPTDLGLLTGTDLPEGARPVAMAYSGHQFGFYSPRLGDGRALLLGELPDGRDLHLKGSGRTPFARGGDGKAVLGPMLREYVLSEAMHALGIPTTRALAVVATGDTVLRETPQPGAVLARVAASHIRVGTFQYVAALDDVALLRRLADHAIARHYPEADGALGLYEQVVEAQAALVARWMLVGFVHGVMNTDNTTISGETIDYGPCAFLDTYDPATVFSSIDERGRYAYGNQPAVLQWNLARFGETLLPLIDGDAVEAATAVLRTFAGRYDRHFRAGMLAKLGLTEDPDSLVDDLLTLLAAERPDFTLFFRALAGSLRGGPAPTADPWFARWLAAGPDADAMDRVNPVYIPRNHLVEEALAGGEPLDRLLAVLADPFRVRPGLERYAEPGPAGPYVTYCGT